MSVFSLVVVKKGGSFELEEGARPPHGLYHYEKKDALPAHPRVVRYATTQR